MGTLDEEAARLGANLDFGAKAATLINKEVQKAGQVAEMFGVPGASMLGGTLSGGGAEVKSGSSLPELQSAQTPPALESPPTLQGGQFSGGGAKYPNAIETGGAPKVAEGISAATKALPAAGSSALGGAAGGLGGAAALLI